MQSRRDSRHRCPIQCILPPHMLKSLAANGSAAQRKLALNILEMDHTFRSIRLGFGEFRRPVFEERRRIRMATALPWLATAVAAQPNRHINIAAGPSHQKLPGTTARTEGAPSTGDIEVDEAYDGFGATWSLYYQVYQRNSIDGEGMQMVGNVHFSENYDNAFWDGQQMNFGDGDGTTFNRFTSPVDIMGHELTHGVTQYESNLIYMGQSGALNEHISDAFGTLVKQYQNNQTAANSDWLIGEGLLVPDPPHNTAALRSLKAPGTAYNTPALGQDPQPAHMNKYQYTFQDNGGVHINSGIPNHAFYLAATAIGGNAWEKTGLIWYEACTSPFMRTTMRFKGFASLTVSIAAQLFGQGGMEENAVRSAWAAVGINV
jgi:Zn-dependent metalloprotease